MPTLRSLRYVLGSLLLVASIACGGTQSSAHLATRAVSETNDHAWGGVLALDGDLLAVGGDNLSAVHLYRRQESGSWEYEAALSPSTPGGRFGISLAISRGTHDQICVGAMEQEAVYVFEKGSAGWVQIGEPLRVPEDQRLPHRAWFGHSVSIEGGRLIVGAPLWGATSDQHAGAFFVFGPTDSDEWGLEAYTRVPSRIDAPGNASTDFQLGRVLQSNAGELAVGAMWGMNESRILFYDPSMAVGSEISWTLNDRLSWFELGENEVFATVRQVANEGRTNESLLEVWTSNHEHNAWNKTQTLRASTGANLFGSIALSGTRLVVRGKDPTPPCVQLLGENRAGPACPPTHPETEGLFLFEKQNGQWAETAFWPMRVNDDELGRNLVASEAFFAYRNVQASGETTVAVVNLEATEQGRVATHLFAPQVL